MVEPSRARRVALPQQNANHEIAKVRNHESDDGQSLSRRSSYGAVSSFRTLVFS